MDNLGQKIKKRREELGLSQEDLAKILGYKHKSSTTRSSSARRMFHRKRLPALH